MVRSGELADAGLINAKLLCNGSLAKPCCSERSDALNVVLAELAIAAVAVLHRVIHIPQIPGSIVAAVAVDVVNGVFRVVPSHPLPDQAMVLDPHVLLSGVVVDLPIPAVEVTKRT